MSICFGAKFIVVFIINLRIEKPTKKKGQANSDGYGQYNFQNSLGVRNGNMKYLGGHEKNEKQNTCYKPYPTKAH